MKKFYWFVLILVVANLGFSNSNSPIKFFKNLKEVNDISLLKSGTGLITYFHVSNSINGPFTSPATLTTKDSLFLKMDVTPSGTIYAIFWVDINENDMIDSDDFPIGSEMFTDGSPMDLDPTQGVILVELDPEFIPSMKIIAQAFEGSVEVLGYVEFVNPPATFTFMGNVYDEKTLEPIKAATVMAFLSQEEGYADITNLNGEFSIPLEAGMYYIRIEHLLGLYQPFDTLIFIEGNTSHDFYLKTFTSYIRGYVRDDLNNPIPNIEVYVSVDGWGSGTITDSSGAYLIFVPSGGGRIGLSSNSLIPNYMVPMEHYFQIAENDSIVDNPISNFKCYRGNAVITGQVIDQIHMPPKPPYVVSAWSSELSSYTETLTDGNGNYSLKVHSSNILEPLYGVWVNTSHWMYPFPEDVYIDTSYWNLTPGSVANFRVIPAETTGVDHFYGHNVPPDYTKWYTFSFGNPWGGDNIESYILCMNDKLEIKCKSGNAVSGLGIISRKPFSLRNREYKIYLDPQNLGLNTAHIMFTNEYRYDQPIYFNKWVMLSWSANGWSLDVRNDNMQYNLWWSNNPAGTVIQVQFLVNPKILRLFIDGDLKYDGPYGGHLPFAYFYAYSQNEYATNQAGIAIFDDFLVGALGSTNVKEISDNVPTKFSLLQNYPNPFNPQTKIRYNVPLQSHVTIKIYNTLGQELSTLVNMEHKPGEYEVEFNAINLPTGVYLYKLNAIDILTGRIVFSEIKKSMLMK